MLKIQDLKCQSHILNYAKVSMFLSMIDCQCVKVLSLLKVSKIKRHQDCQSFKVICNESLLAR